MAPRAEHHREEQLAPLGTLHLDRQARGGKAIQQRQALAGRGDPLHTPQTQSCGGVQHSAAQGGR